MITKTVQSIGNGAHIYVPKGWEGRQVQLVPVERRIVDITQEIMGILLPYLKDISGIYLCGSYARSEQDENSDIDILVIGKLPKSVKKGSPPYEIVSMSYEQAVTTLKDNPLLLLPMLKEAKPIMNAGLIGPLKEYPLTEKNTKWYRETTKTALGVVKASLEIDLAFTAEIYSMILRLRGLISLQRFMQGKPYKKGLVLKALEETGLPSQDMYSAYQKVRDGSKTVNIDRRYMELLYDLVKGELKKADLLWAKHDSVRRKKATRSRSGNTQISSRMR